MSDDVQLHKFEGKQYALAKDIQPYFIELANARKRIEVLEAELKAAYANCREEVEKVKTDPFTELAKHQAIQYSSTTARDWMIAMAEDIDRAIQARAALEGKDG
jgi:hypothetical protein